MNNLLSEKGISLERLMSLCAVAKAGSIAQAADRDATRQSLMSRQIGELERFFGVALTRRRGRSLEITEEGRALADIASRQLADLADFKNRMAGLPARFTLGASNTLLQHLVVPRLGRLREELGDVNWITRHETTRETVAGLLDGRLDLGFLRDDALVPRLESALLGELRWSLYVPVALGTKDRDAVRTLSKVPLALPAGGAMREELNRLAEEEGMALDVAVECTSYEHAHTALLTDRFATVLPSMVAEYLPSGQYRSLLLKGLTQASRSIHLAWTPRMAETRSHAPRTIAALKKVLRF